MFKRGKRRKGIKDEMNIHVPQSEEARIELHELAACKHNMISPQSSKPTMAIVQDSLTGSYIMTTGIKVLSKEQFFNIAMSVITEEFTIHDLLKKIEHVSQVCQEKGIAADAYHGKGLVSILLPSSLAYEKKTGVGTEPIVKIYKGVLIEGNINKAVVGNTVGSILHILEKEYGVDTASVFIDSLQFVTNSFLAIYGFSVGIEDCLIPGAISDEKKQEIQAVIERCYIEAEGIKTTTSNPNIREIRVTAALNKAKDSGFRIAKNSLSKDCNFIQTVESGSKGDWFNIAQITGLLGQQNLMGARVKPIFSSSLGKRTLPHYPFGELPVEMEYESKGFIASSFIKGLNPREFFFHAMSGREGVCDTAMGTARSGYIQRRIIKLTEDVKVRYDGTVRDDIGRVYQHSYGDDGFDPSRTVQVGKVQELCNIERMVEKMNTEYEAM